jgi:prepilin-type N-terminal cleavage/methylation domain-containing protein
LNRRGFTLIEVLVAGALFLTVLSSFTYVLKAAAGYVRKLETKSGELYYTRSELERIKQLPFAALSGASSGETQTLQVAGDLYLVRVKAVYTLRSRYQ